MRRIQVRLESFSSRIPENIEKQNMARGVVAGEGIKLFARWDHISREYCNDIIILTALYYAHILYYILYYTCDVAGPNICIFNKYNYKKCTWHFSSIIVILI